MAEAGFHDKIAPDETGDGAGFGWRFDDDEIFGHPKLNFQFSMINYHIENWTIG